MATISAHRLIHSRPVLRLRLLSHLHHLHRLTAGQLAIVLSPAVAEESHSSSTKMLKRQRPSSPISFPDEDTTPADLYEPDSKRRRYFGPPTTAQQKRERNHDHEEDSEDNDGGESGRGEYFIGKREWSLAAGVYKDANSLLHDLHAEQRHRALFSTPQHPDFASADIAPTASYPSHPPRATSSKDHTNSHSAGFPLRDSGHWNSDGTQMIFDGEGRNEQAEAQVVTQRYENPNRLLRALFLGRRMEIGSQDET